MSLTRKTAMSSSHLPPQKNRHGETAPKVSCPNPWNMFVLVHQTSPLPLKSPSLLPHPGSLIYYARATSAANPIRPTAHNYYRFRQPMTSTNQETKQKKKKVRENPHITHTTPQPALHTSRMPPKDIHDHGPSQARKSRPPVPHQCLSQLAIAK